MKHDFAEVRARGVAAVARHLGLNVHLAGKYLGPCPSCHAEKRHPSRKDRRGAVGVTSDGLGWRCFECEAHGDAVSLAALAVTEREKPDDWEPVFQALTGLVDTPPPAQPIAAAPLRPPKYELNALWSASYPLEAVPSDVAPEWTGATRAYLGQERKLEVGYAIAADIARVLPPSSFTYPTWWPATWSHTWRLAVGAYEANGDLASIHARAITIGAEPKTRWPKGCSAGSLLFADRIGREFLRGRVSVGEVVIAEGVMDTIAFAEAFERQPRTTAVLGMTAGGEPALGQVRWPEGCVVKIATHGDTAGEAYAQKIRAQLPGHCDVRRASWSDGGAQ